MSKMFIVALLSTVAVLYNLVGSILYRLRISNIPNRIVFITGCDTGFGNILAKKLDNLGVKVIAGCLTEKGRRDLQSESSPHLKTVLLDVTSKGSVANAYEFVKANINGQGLLFC